MTAAKKKRAAKREPGRPTKYSDKLGAEICRRLAEGESVRKICDDGAMPHVATVMRWLFNPLDEDDPKLEFREQYARAREAQAELNADEIIDIADDSGGDVTAGEDGGETVNHENIARSRLRVDARKWVSSKLRPKVYGERVAHTGPDGGPIHLDLSTALTDALTKARNHEQRIDGDQD